MEKICTRILTRKAPFRLKWLFFGTLVTLDEASETAMIFCGLSGSCNDGVCNEIFMLMTTTMKNETKIIAKHCTVQ
jgi:hypothetical protein